MEQIERESLSIECRQRLHHLRAMIKILTQPSRPGDGCGDVSECCMDRTSSFVLVYLDGRVYLPDKDVGGVESYRTGENPERERH